MQTPHHHLAAILFTDIVGYTALMQKDETKAIAVIRCYNSVLEKLVADNNGEVVNYYGDGSLCTFASATEAVNCAIKIQQQLLLSEPSVPLRIGLHVAELFFEEGKPFGDGVNIASRIQSMGKANTILFSKEIFDKIRNQHEFKSICLGLFEFANVDDPVEVFALANNGLHVPKQEELTGKFKNNQSKNITHTPKKGIVTLFACLILIIAGIFISSYLKNKDEFTDMEKSIAVLPFQNIGGEKENEYFSDGITEDITAQLGMISGLNVISRTSAMRYKQSRKSIKQIAKELNVSAILEGSIQRSGNQLRITAQLINARTDKHIWANRYDKTLDAIFVIQQDVSTQIASALKATLSDQSKKIISKPLTNFYEAYDLYLKGRFYWNKRTKSDLLLAIQYFEKAIHYDPDFSRAYSGLADSYTILCDNGFLPVDSVALKARTAVEKALLLDSNLSEVKASYALYLSIIEGNTTAAVKELEKAISINPNYAPAFQWLADEFAVKEQFNKSLAYIDKAINLDPLSERIYASKAAIYCYSRQYDMAINHLKQTPETIKNKAQKTFIAELFYLKGINDSVKYYSQLGDDKMWILFSKPDIPEYKNELRRLASLTPVSAEKIAYYYTLINEKDSAFAWLNRSIKNKEYASLNFLKVDPHWDPLRKYPRFDKILKSTGIH